VRAGEAERAAGHLGARPGGQRRRPPSGGAGGERDVVLGGGDAGGGVGALAEQRWCAAGYHRPGGGHGGGGDGPCELAAGESAGGGWGGGAGGGVLLGVARLAARHGIRVRLRPASMGGLTALVWLPDEVIAHETSATPPGLRRFESAGASATAPAGAARLADWPEPGQPEDRTAAM